MQADAVNKGKDIFMKKKIIISAVSVGLALAVIGASVGVYMSYINKIRTDSFPNSTCLHKIGQSERRYAYNDG